MASDSEQTNSDDGAKIEEAATRIDRLTDALKPDVEGLSPEQWALLAKGVKIAFTVALIVLLIYWVAAYQLEIQLFEF